MFVQGGGAREEEECKHGPGFDRLDALQGWCFRTHRRVDELEEPGGYHWYASLPGDRCGETDANVWSGVGALAVKLTDDEIKYLEEPYQPLRIAGHV